jgi:hypothetical protein
MIDKSPIITKIPLYFTVPFGYANGRATLLRLIFEPDLEDKNGCE